MAKRTLIQILTAFLYNGNLPGFLNGRIWQGPSKSICVPGLNCYSCPGALGACPLGALQSSLSGVLLRFPFYVLGLMLLFGLLFGRTVCGYHFYGFQGLRTYKKKYTTEWRSKYIAYQKRTSLIFTMVQVLMVVNQRVADQPHPGGLLGRLMKSVQIGKFSDN